MPKNDWNQYKQLFLYELGQNQRRREEDEKRWEKVIGTLETLTTDVHGLKIKAAMAGGAAGVVGTALVTFVFSLWK